MEWYLPITILPGVGVLILSTTNQMLAISREVGELLDHRCSKFQHNIADRKIKQLTRLTTSAALLYISAACFVSSGILGAIIPMMEESNIPNYVLIAGVVLVLVALAILVNYGFQSISIRKFQHKHNHKQ